MKYQSELIKEIVDTRGHHLSSPHYESECVKSWIEETKGAYPKLCDYESEWLNYINENPLGDFSYETVSVVSEATVDNVVPYAYKRAILKGNTLVNIKGEETNQFKNLIGRCINDYILNPVKDNTKYLILYDLTTTDTIKIGLLRQTNDTDVEWTNSTEYIASSNGKVILNSGTGGKFIRFISSENNTHEIKHLTIIEYQQGMENWDIPYFEGMQSVKMPVLTTSNEDGTKTNILTVNEEVELRGIGEVQDELNLLTGELTERIGEITFDGSDDETWVRNGALSNNYETSFFTLSVDNVKRSIGHITKICDKFPVLADYSHTKDIEGVTQVTDNQMSIRVLKTSLSDDSVEGLKAYLQSNPITVQYQFITKSVKTVALTPLNKPYEGTNHYHLTANIPCEAILEVPVDSTGKQTIEEINN